MGSLRRKFRVRPLPETATATITEKNGKRFAMIGKQAVEVFQSSSGGWTWRQASKCWYARFCDHRGVEVERCTKCSDKSAAEQVMNRWLREQEKIAAGVLSPEELDVVRYGTKPLSAHVQDYAAHQKARRLTANTRNVTASYLIEAVAFCGWRTLKDLSKAGAERWLTAYLDGVIPIPGDKEGRCRVGGLRSRNARLEVLRAFGKWLVREGRLMTSPFDGIGMLNAKTDPKRSRRALDDDELARLFESARRRPLQNFLDGNRGKVDARPDVMARLKQLGLERELVYRVLAGTGLRWNELRSVKLGALRLDEEPACIVLAAADEKNRQGSIIPLTRELVVRLRKYLDDRLVSGRAGQVAVLQIDSAEPLFPGMGDRGTKVFDRDLEFAGIPKRTAAGSADVHCLRHSFGTRLAKSGAPVQIIQRAMRHSDPKLTLGTYSHLTALDVLGSLEALPEVQKRKGDDTAEKANTEMCGISTGKKWVLKRVLTGGKPGHSSGTSGIKGRTLPHSAYDTEKHEKPKENEGFRGNEGEKKMASRLWRNDVLVTGASLQDEIAFCPGVALQPDTDRGVVGAIVFRGRAGYRDGPERCGAGRGNRQTPRYAIPRVAEVPRRFAASHTEGRLDRRRPPPTIHQPSTRPATCSHRAVVAARGVNLTDDGRPNCGRGLECSRSCWERTLLIQQFAHLGGKTHNCKRFLQKMGRIIHDTMMGYRIDRIT